MIVRRVKAVLAQNFRDCFGMRHELPKGAIEYLPFKNVREFNAIMATGKMREIPEVPQVEPEVVDAADNVVEVCEITEEGDVVPLSSQTVEPEEVDGEVVEEQ